MSAALQSLQQAYSGHNKAGQSFGVHPFSKGTIWDFYLEIESIFNTEQSCPSTISSKKIMLWGNKMVAWKIAYCQSN